MFDPTTVKSPTDLPKELSVVIETSGDLRLAARRPFQFGFTWLREVSAGKIEGDIGLTVQASGEASLEFSVADAYRKQISLDEFG